VRGKIDFGKDGLAYNKTGASFTINKGIYHTSNFLPRQPLLVIKERAILTSTRRRSPGHSRCRRSLRSTGRSTRYPS
jgi:hypothetical protein